MRSFFVGLILVLGVAQPALSLSIAAESKSTADHSKFKELKGPFKSGEEVTKACIGCHTEAAQQVMKTRHWTWEYKNPADGKTLGKKTMVNNFCIGNFNDRFWFSCGCSNNYQRKLRTDL